MLNVEKKAQFGLSKQILFTYPGIKLEIVLSHAHKK